MFKKDLIYICEYVDEWVDSYITHVRLDCDGEICFLDYTTQYDFYPEGEDVTHNFKHFEDGKDYTKEEFLACKEYLAKQEASVDDSTDLVIKKVKLRIQEITKRHEQALQEELKPLVEVLQRRGETL